MKKIYLFFVLFIIYGCGSKTISSSNLVNLTCPPVLFASEHKVYIGTESENILLNNISYHAQINNAVFSTECVKENNIFHFNLSLLFIVKPLDKTNDIIKLPFYIAIVDKDKNLRDLQYYLISDKFKKNLETKKNIETEIIENLSFNVDLVDESFKIIVGFILDKKRLKLLN